MGWFGDATDWLIDKQYGDQKEAIKEVKKQSYEQQRQRIIAKANEESQRTGESVNDILDRLAQTEDLPDYLRIGLENRYRTPEEIESMIKYADPEWNEDAFAYDPIGDIPVVGDVVRSGGEVVADVVDIKDDITGKNTQKAIEKSTELQAEAAEKALKEQEKNIGDILEMARPSREIMDQTMADMYQGIEEGQYTAAPFEFDESQYTMPDEFSFTYEDFEETPYYQYLQDTAAKQIQRSAAARGGLASGGTLAALQDRSQAIAGREFQNQYQREKDQYGLQYGAAADERAFGYGQSMDDFNRGRIAGLDKYSQQAQLAGLGAPGFQGSMQATQNYGSNVSNILGQQANARAGGLIGQANAEAQGTQNMLGTAALLYGAFSDRRLKKDIKPVGKWKDYDIYQFRYLWSPKTYIGVMADEVKATNPGAVTETEDGYMMVDYGRL